MQRLLSEGMIIKHKNRLPVAEKGHSSTGANSLHRKQDNFHHLPSSSTGDGLSLSALNIHVASVLLTVPQAFFKDAPFSHLADWLFSEKYC